jgi:hypothetical protein
MGILFALTTETSKDKDGQVKLPEQPLLFSRIV